MADPGSAPASVDPSEQVTLTLLSNQLSLLMAALLQASRSTGEPTKLMQISNEMTAVQSLVAQVAQAQAAANDAVFAQATAALSAQANVLTGMEKQIKTFVTDAGDAGRIVGYIAQAVALIAKL